MSKLTLDDLGLAGRRVLVRVDFNVPLESGEDGRQTESEYSIRLYSLHELGQMMQQVGFRVKEVSGQQATRGVFFGAQSNRIILLAERKTQSPARANGNGHSDAPPPTES